MQQKKGRTTEKMSLSTSGSETEKNTNIAADTEVSHATVGSSSSGEKFTSNDVDEKQDGVEATDTEPEYLTGFKLSLVMCTIYLSTLLAALDIVSISPSILSYYLLIYLFAGHRRYGNSSYHR